MDRTHKQRDFLSDDAGLQAGLQDDAGFADGAESAIKLEKPADAVASMWT